MINVLDKWEVGGAWCRSGNTKPWPATPMRPRLKLDIPVFAKRINHYSSIISQFSSDTAESSVCNGQLFQGGEFACPRYHVWVIVSTQGRGPGPCPLCEIEGKGHQGRDNDDVAPIGVSVG